MRVLEAFSWERSLLDSIAAIDRQDGRYRKEWTSAFEGITWGSYESHKWVIVLCNHLLEVRILHGVVMAADVEVFIEWW